jgi:hypothetical protein
MLPLAQRFINGTWKQCIGTTPHALIHWAPSDLDRGLFAPFRENAVVPPLSNEFVSSLHAAYERLLDETSLCILKDQLKMQREFGESEATDFQVGSLVLLSYSVRPPSKLSARWAGPYRVVAKDSNNLSLEDLTGGPSKVVDVSRVKPFLVAPGVDPQAVAAADMGESLAISVLAHKGSSRQRSSLSFQIEWSDGDVTWEPWENVKKLSIIDEYIRSPAGQVLKALLGK